jgi:hypothetical protein
MIDVFKWCSEYKALERQTKDNETTGSLTEQIGQYDDASGMYYGR